LNLTAYHGNVDWCWAGGLSPADERHLRRHDSEELDVGVERQACHVDDRASHFARVDGGLGRDRSVGLRQPSFIRAVNGVAAFRMSIWPQAMSLRPSSDVDRPARDRVLRRQAWR
jgi:hypothetical protein